MRSRTMILSAATLVMVASAPASLAAQDSVKVERPSATLITREQLEQVKVSSLFEAVEALHNNWLIEKLPVPQDRSRGGGMDTTGRMQYTADYSGAGKSAAGGAGGIQVYLDGTRMGGTAELKNIRALDIYSVRRMSGSEAQGRYGIGHSSGVLAVTTMTAKARP